MDGMEFPLNGLRGISIHSTGNVTTPMENGNSTQSIRWKFHSIGVVTLPMEFPRQWNFHSIMRSKYFDLQWIHASGNARFGLRNFKFL